MKGKIFITGGAGTLGRAIIERGKKDDWDAQFTIYSTDPNKHHAITADFPDMVSVIGDILDYGSLAQAMAGHDIVIHAAAMKFIPEGEKFPHYTFEVNVNGSYNVIQAALQNNVKQVVGISTDKAAKPINSYGASKMMMERLFQEAALGDLVKTKFHLVRYGNVLGSRGSFIHAWKRDLKEHGKIFATDPEMTRFWLTVDTAVHLIERTLEEDETGVIRIPFARGVSMDKIKSWLFADAEVEYLGLRPGEKMHETLITAEECYRCFNSASIFRLYPPTSTPTSHNPVWEGKGFMSNHEVYQLEKEEFTEMIGGWQ